VKKPPGSFNVLTQENLTLLGHHLPRRGKKIHLIVDIWKQMLEERIMRLANSQRWLEGSET
jgi:hypothetical protein